MKPHRKSPSSAPSERRSTPARKLTPTRLRIIAGELGGRKIEYNGDPLTRPMKERTRESVFSLLGGYLEGTFAIDLFGGTGILAIESISRGAEQAIVLEMSRPAVTTIIGNLQKLGLDHLVEVYNVDTLRWLRNLEEQRLSWPDLPWVVFCCPPYQMWHSETQRLCDGLMAMLAASPVGSRLVCECERDFDLAAAMPNVAWDIRKYEPAFIGICEKS